VSSNTESASKTPANVSNVALSAANLSKSFGGYQAVVDVSFSLPKGQLVAFLGPNGAGKSTTMRMLTGFLTPTAGRAEVCGMDVVERRVEVAAKIGYLPESGALYGDMTPVQLLRFFGSARGMSGSKLDSAVDAALEQCRLTEVTGKPIGKLSRGYRQRVGLAQAILHEPEVLILDEPTAGLDPNQVDQVRQLLKSLSRERTVLLSTHILTEVRALADRILMIHRGRLVHDGLAGSLGATETEMERRFKDLTRDVAMAGAAAG
jgi:ABC-2 type transport system ATP-binding protein